MLGGGISGLAFTYFCSRRGLPVHLLEAGGRLGGAIETVSVPGCETPLELGAHTLNSSYLHTIALLDELKLGIVATSKKTVLIDDGYRTRSVVSALDKFELMRSLIQAAMNNRFPIRGTIESYCTGILGRRNYLDVVRPLLYALLNQNPDSVPATYLAEKMKKKDRYSGVPPRFTVSGGLQKLVDKLGSNIEFELNSRAESIERVGENFQVVTNSGVLACAQVVLAVPFSECRKLTRGFFSEADISGEQDVTIHTSVVRKDSCGAGPTIAAYRNDTVNSEIQFDTKSPLIVRHAVSPGEKGIAEEVLMNKVSMIPNLSASHRMPEGEKIHYLGNWVAGLSVELCIRRSHEVFTKIDSSFHLKEK